MKMDFPSIEKPSFWVIVFTFFFDTVRTRVGVSSRVGMLNKDGNLPNVR